MSVLSPQWNIYISSCTQRLVHKRFYHQKWALFITTQIHPSHQKPAHTGILTIRINIINMQKTSKDHSRDKASMATVTSRAGSAPTWMKTAAAWVKGHPHFPASAVFKNTASRRVFKQKWIRQPTSLVWVKQGHYGDGDLQQGLRNVEFWNDWLKETERKHTETKTTFCSREHCIWAYYCPFCRDTDSWKIEAMSWRSPADFQWTTVLYIQFSKKCWILHCQPCKRHTYSIYSLL